MALTTYAQTVVILRSRIGGYMDYAELTNDHCEACISWATREAGGTTADHATVTDAEITAVANSDFLIDLAELCLIKSIIGHLTLVDIKQDVTTAKLSQLSKHMFMLKKNKEAYMKSVYGYGFSTLEPRIWNKNFQETL